MKPVPSLVGYFADDQGNIWRDGAVVRPRRHSHGYWMISVRPSGNRYVHRLVCEAYHGPCPGGMHCRHLDGSRTNNKPDNLRWGTKAENEADKLVHGTLPRGEAIGGSVLSDAMVQDARRRTSRGETPQDLALEYGVNAHTLTDAIMGRKWKHLPGAVPKFTSRRKLHSEDVVAIRSLYASGHLQREIAERFGVCQASISHVLHGKTILSSPQNAPVTERQSPRKTSPSD